MNVAFTSLNHEFRLAFPLYLAGILSLPLLWFVRHPVRLPHPVGRVVVTQRPLLDDDVAAVGVGQR